MDAAKASTIISDLKGSNKEATSSEHADASPASNAPVAVKLESGMMSRDSAPASTAADHVDAKADDSAAATHAGDSSSTKDDSELSGMGGNFAAAVDNWLKKNGNSVVDESLVQEASLGLRGRRTNAQKLVSVRLHKSSGFVKDSV